MSKITIRPLVVADIPYLSWTGDESHIESFTNHMQRTSSGGVVFIGAQIGDELVGRCGIDFEKVENAGFLWMFNVREDVQRQGIGTLIMDACEQEIRSRAKLIAQLHVEKENTRAQDLYVRRGYSVIGEDKESWEVRDDDGRPTTYYADVVVMRKEL